jgi:hypothetical protein
MVIVLACNGGRDVQREIDVVQPDDEQARLASPTSGVVLELKRRDGPESLTYDPPVSLARPLGATVWPHPAVLPAGTGQVRPDSMPADTSARGTRTRFNRP